MPLIYSSVSRGALTLAEYAAFSGNFSSVAKDFLEKGGTAGKYTYTVDGHTFNFFSKGGFTFLVVADVAYGREIPLNFLEKVSDKFISDCGEKGRVATAGSLTGSFGKQLKLMMEHATQYPEEYSKMISVQKQVNEVKSIMTENIDKVLQRGDKLEVLTDKTENLMTEADRFVRNGRSIRRTMWWQSLKMKLIVACALVLLGVVIFLLVCFSGGNCLK